MLIHLVGARASVVVDLATGVPTVRHWGARLEPDTDLDAAFAVLERPIVHGMLDIEAPVSLVPEHALGYPGRPGLAGHRRAGRDWSARFEPVSHEIVVGVGVTTLTAIANDPVAQLTLTSVVELGEVLRVQLTIANDHPSERYLFDRLDPTLPLPAHTDELLTFTGRWTREMHPHRVAFRHGAVTAENRTGRTSHEHPPLVFAGTHGFGEWAGEVWGVHLAWSGNHAMLAEVLPDGRRSVQMGELFHPGEMSLRPGESYTTPEVIGSYSPNGLTEASWGFHRALRARPQHPSPARPRPVLLNTWEAVYFDHDAATLRELADVAAAIGIERFVLDDGWFGSRRDDTSGLGDWHVSADAHPEGLAPLIAHVRELGMDFGIWVEPEMVNPDSDLHRAHPEWALATPGYEPVLGRQQLVLNLAIPDAFQHILGALDALLGDHDIAFVKWDMNRNHAQGSGGHGAAGAHEQTLALYRLLDELRSRHPGVEFESCASGGGRIDHEILRRAERVWTSDSNDALERQVIQRGASMFIPPEVMGAHIGPRRAHTTGRQHSLGFRAITAMFGHLGVEWNVLRLRDDERAALAAVIALHKRFRHLLHSGDVVRFDSADGAAFAHGVYARDRGEALVAVAQLTTAAALAPAPVRLPGLDPVRRYRVQRIAMPDDASVLGPTRVPPAWLAGEAEVGGRDLEVLGLQLPAMQPETAMLLHLHAV
ncbi:MAG: alpha-galactosidase [Ilumatobacteraceae bacterium]|nr:alpha-galactosidase [Ilumatobacteraceae bacterium]